MANYLDVELGNLLVGFGVEGDLYLNYFVDRLLLSSPNLLVIIEQK